MKKQILKSALIALAGVGLMSGVAFAVPGVALQNVLNDITITPVNSSINVTTDYISDINDSYWNITGSGASAATMIIELAGYANYNTFGVYNSGKYVKLFDGTQAAGAQAFLSIKDDGSVWVNNSDTGIDFVGYSFAYYLNTPEGVWYSDTALNTDKFDHMYAYQGKNTDIVDLPGVAPGLWTDNEFILAWDDQRSGGDKDFDDFVVMVESVMPVPEPATMLMFGTGMIGLASVARRKK